MLEHEVESDEDDCEVYFLKPVNEYNIVDKIKEANKELFALESADETDATALNMSRKVTFAPNLEDYEPDGRRGTSGEKEPPDGIELKLEADFKFPPIDEEIGEQAEEERPKAKEESKEGSVADDETLKESEYLNEKVAEPPEDDPNNANNEDKDAEVVEEICEEIIVMDMDSSRTASERQPKSSVSPHQRSRMIKEATFDYDGEDSKSLTNLLTSDFEEEDDDDEDKEDADEMNNDGDDDDDDDLSIIVASYIPDTFDKDSLISEKDDRKQKSKKVPFSKRFSFRRKTGTSNTVGSASFASSSSRGSGRHLPPPEVTELKLNYKTCCEYRNAVQEKLPKYTGYLSEYGLTSEQLAKREDKQKKKKRFVLEQALKANEQEMRKMQDNERAFTTWLKQKMRFPINKTRNMFDVKFPACGGSSAVRNRINSGKIK